MDTDEQGAEGGAIPGMAQLWSEQLRDGEITEQEFEGYLWNLFQRFDAEIVVSRLPADLVERIRTDPRVTDPPLSPDEIITTWGGTEFRRPTAEDIEERERRNRIRRERAFRYMNDLHRLFYDDPAQQ